jgi:predicted lipoprotein
VRQENRLERILFFPDRRGIALRQIQGLIASEDETALDPQAFNAKSVAVQGLPALEYILHGSGAETLGFLAADSYRCELAAAIAGNIGGIANAVSAEWQDENGVSALLVKPGADNLLYPNTDEALLAILEILPDAYELLIETRLKPFIGESPKDTSPKRHRHQLCHRTYRALRTPDIQPSQEGGCPKNAPRRPPAN